MSQEMALRGVRDTRLNNLSVLAISALPVLQRLVLDAVVLPSKVKRSQRYISGWRHAHGAFESTPSKRQNRATTSRPAQLTNKPEDDRGVMATVDRQDLLGFRVRNLVRPEL